MSVSVVMPQLGLTMTEGSVSEWLKQPGDLVHKGEMLFVVSTDKADMEVESLDEGHLIHILVQPGTVVPVGTVIAYLGQPGEKITASPIANNIGTATSSIQHKSEGQHGIAAVANSVAVETSTLREGGLPSSPRARKLARDLGVDISKVPPSGGRERIVEDDVQQYAASLKSVPISAETRRRRVIAERLTQSVQTIPHFSLSVEVRADKLTALYQSLKAAGPQQAGPKITVTDLLLKALGLGLVEVPAMRATWEGGNLQNVETIDLGLAIAADSGVVAPVIRNVARLPITEIARWRSDVAEKARGGRLTLTDLEGGIGTLSNLGMFRVSQFQAIISPGQSFILAVGKIDRRPWVEAGELIAAQTLNLTLSVDHRVADGAVAARFLESIAAGIENPECLQA